MGAGVVDDGVGLHVANDRGTDPLPQRSSGAPNTATSSTPASADSTFSTSAGYTFTPPEMMRSSRRLSMKR